MSLGATCCPLKDEITVILGAVTLPGHCPLLLLSLLELRVNFAPTGSPPSAPCTNESFAWDWFLFTWPILTVLVSNCNYESTTHLLA